MAQDWISNLGFSSSPPAPSSKQKEEREEPNLQENIFESYQVQQLCKESLDFLAGFMMPLVFKYLFPLVFKTIWAWLISYVHKKRDFSRLAIGIPRGFGKTMLMKIFILYTILFTSKQFILIVCGTQAKAINIITDITGMLSNKNVQRVFGDWKLGAETNRQELKRFGFRGRNIILLGAGVGTDIRGITLENWRPDVMVFDDIQSREDADSETVSNNILTWFVGTALKAKSPEGCLYIFIANMYPTKHSLLKKLKADPTWIKFIVGGILFNGESLWEELQPVHQLLEEYRGDLSIGKPEIFYAEVLNDENASVNHLVDLSKLPPYPFSDDEQHTGNFVIIDPATDKAGSDEVTVMYFEIHQNIPVCKKIKEGRFSPGETIHYALIFCLETGATVVGIESNAYQYTLNYWFNFICLQKGIIGINAVELYSGTYSKNARILGMFKSLLTGEILVHPSCSSQVNLQITSFNPLKRDNVDGILDCLTYAPKLIELYSDLLFNGLTLEMQEAGSRRIFSEAENAAF